MTCSLAPDPTGSGRSRPRAQPTSHRRVAVRPLGPALTATLIVLAIAGAGLLAPQASLAQGTSEAAQPSPVPPWPSAGAAEISRSTQEAEIRRPSAAPPAPALQPRNVARVFHDACILHEGDLQPAVDWAISQGFEPLDVLSGEAQALLEGRAGTILAAPGTARQLMLAVAQGRHCTVWSERVAGPAVRLALLQMLGERSARGDQVTQDLDRKVERAGAWRQQTQWRYRRVGGSAEYGIGAVTTIVDAPAAQVLRWAPLAPTLGFAPDGTPIR